MKIVDPAAAYRLYSQYSVSPQADAGQSGGLSTVAAKADPIKTDTVSLSGRAAQNGELGRLAQKVTSEISTAVSGSRLEQLREAVENGEYYIPTAQLADAVLSVLA